MNSESNELMFSNRYIAGLVDSDGNIYLDYHKNKNNSYYPVIRVSISQKHPILLFNLKNQLKCGSVNKIKEKNCWIYEINSKGAEKLLENIKAYLKNKAAQACMALSRNKTGTLKSIEEVKESKQSISNARFNDECLGDFDLEWFSGYFDGDGYIGLYKNKNAKNSGRIKMTITIDKKDRYIANYFKSGLGGNIYKSSDNIRWDYNISKTDLDFLKNLSNLSKLKKSQINKCIEFLNIDNPSSNTIIEYVNIIKDMKKIDNQEIIGDIDINDYQKWSRELVKYDTKKNMGIYYTCLGLGEEAGEVCGVISKIIRDNGHRIEPIHKEKILKELGDVLFYSARLADELGLDLKSIITNNVKKLEGRLERNVIHGSGSDR